MEEDYYKILGLEKNASSEDIKKAYRKLSLQHHPDRNNNSEESNELFKKIQNAYEILSDEDKRRNYDNGGMSNFNGMPFPPGNFRPGPGGTMHMNIDPSEIFNFFSKNIFNMANNFTGQNGNNGQMPGGVHVFNMSNMKTQLMKPPPIIKNIEITLSKAYSGCTVPIDITRWIIENNVKREENETLYVDIPQGIDNNEIIIMRDKGNVLADNNKGDIKIFIKINNDTCFIRNGLDLILNKTINLKEALCGFTMDMKYIDGREFKINNNKGNIITTNYNKVLHNMGMKRGGHSGNLIINFNVAFPEKLSDEQIEKLSNIL